MGFFAPWFLAGALAVGLPLWVHLLRQHRNTPRLFASLMFMERRTQSSIKQRRLKHYLLLALRLAMILLLALLFANPYIKRSVPLVGGKKLLLVAVDRSFSMRYGDHLDRAKRDALSALSSLKAGDVGQVAAISDHVELMTQQVADRPTLEAAIRSIQPGDATSSYAEFARYLRSLPKSANLPVEAHFFSDVQKSAMPASFGDLALADRVTLQLHPITERDAPNWVVETVNATERVFGAGKPRVQTTVAGIGTMAQKRTVTLLMNGKEVQSKSVDVPENGRAQVEFVNVDVQYGSNKGEVRTDGGDSLPQDNRMFFSVDRAEPGKALYIYDSRQTPAYYRAALEAGADSAFQLDAVTTEQAGNVGLNKYSYVVLASPAGLSGSLEANLKQYVNAGGGLLISLGPATAAAGKVPVIDTKIQDGRYYSRSGERFQTATSVDMTHPAMQRSSALDGVKFFYAAKIDPGQDRVLAKLSDGTPLLVEHRLGEGRVLVFASSFDNATNDLPLHALFVPFVEHASRYLEGGEARHNNATVGASIELRKSKDRGAAAEVIGPDGQRALSLKEAATALSFTADREGFYDVQTASGKHQLIAVNADRRESDLTPIPDETLALWRGTGSGSKTAAGAGPGSGQEPEPQSFWKWVLLALIAVAVGESWLADRFTSATRDERLMVRDKRAAA